MKKNLLLHFSCILFIISALDVNAARLVLVAPQTASTNGEPFTISIYVDSEGKKISALSGMLSFNNELFTVDTITSRNSIVSLWIKQPKIVATGAKNGTTTIAFEGIIPGGYDGVRSPYYKDKHPGIVFLLSLRPKNEGLGVVTLHDTELHVFDRDGTRIPTEPQTALITVPHQSIVYSPVAIPLMLTTSNTLEVSLERNKLIANNAWHIKVNEDQTIRPIQRMYLAESDSYSPIDIQEDEWKEIEDMYILKNQKRNMYIHVKVEYQNNTYTYVTLPPVENLAITLYSSRILLGVVCVFILFLLYRYGYYIAKNIKNGFSKKH